MKTNVDTMRGGEKHKDCKLLILLIKNGSRAWTKFAGSKFEHGAFFAP